MYFLGRPAIRNCGQFGRQEKTEVFSLAVEAYVSLPFIAKWRDTLRVFMRFFTSGVAPVLRLRGLAQIGPAAVGVNSILMVDEGRWLKPRHHFPYSAVRLYVYAAYLKCSNRLRHGSCVLGIPNLPRPLVHKMAARASFPAQDARSLAVRETLAKKLDIWQGFSSHWLVSILAKVRGAQSVTSRQGVPAL